MVLEGFKIASFCHFLQGPAAMQYLSDMGAEVVKVEPLEGAYERHWASAGQTRINGVTPFFLSGNRNVRSLAVDLKSEDGKKLALKLIMDSHAVAENFRPGVLDRLGLGYEAVKAMKPDIIYASASGYGGDGPLVDRPGQDLLIQAMSGMTHSAALGGRRPAGVGFAAVDQHGAAMLALGMAGAYAKWLRTGEGTRVEANLLNSGIDLQQEALTTYFACGRGRSVFNRAEPLATWFNEAPYGVYPIRDGFVALSLNPLKKLAQALKTDRFRDLYEADTFEQRDAIAERVAGELATWNYDELAAAFDAEGVWYARVNDFDEVAENPQAHHNQIFDEFDIGDRKVKLVNHPVRYDGAVRKAEYFPLEAGADTRAVLDALGYTRTEIDDLVDRSVVRAA